MPRVSILGRLTLHMLMSVARSTREIAGHFVIRWFVAKENRKMAHCKSLSLMKAAKMIVRYAAVVRSIWASHSVAIVMTTCCYRSSF